MDIVNSTADPDTHYGWGLIDIDESIRELRRLYCPGCD